MFSRLRLFLILLVLGLCGVLFTGILQLPHVSLLNFVSRSTVNPRDKAALPSRRERRNAVQERLADDGTEGAENLIDILSKRCNNPKILKSSLSNSQEGRFEGISGYELALVQVVTRHGDRAPFGEIPLVNSAPFLCPSGYHYFVSPYKANLAQCSNAKLTWIGCKQHRILGEHFRTVYNLQPSKQLSQKLLVLSTRYQRTIYSAHCLAYGLLGHSGYGNLFLSNGFFFQDTILQETKLHISTCPSLKLFEDELRAQPAFVKSKLKWERVKAETNTYLGLVKNKSNLKFGALEYYEGLVCHFCHHYSRDWLESITPRVGNQRFPLRLAEKVVKAADLETEYLCNEKIALLHIQPLLATIVNQMSQSMKGHRKVQFVLYSGHDLTIIYLLTALGAFDGHRPNYAARVVFELWKRKESESLALVRTLYNGQLVQSRLINGSMPLELFAERLASGDLRSKSSYIFGCLRRS